ESAPPESNNEPLTGGKHQEPAGGWLAGVFNVSRKEEKTPQVAQTLQQDGPSSAASPARPDFRRVVPQDLKDTGRLLVLYERAGGWCWRSRRSAGGWLRRVSAAGCDSWRRPSMRGLSVRRIRAACSCGW